MSYAPDDAELFRGTAADVDRILRGSKHRRELESDGAYSGDAERVAGA
jgi:hypothetical protein